MKKLAILGCTGSIGTNALKIARHLKDQMCVKVLAAQSNIDLLEQQAKEFHPELVAVYNEDKAIELKKRMPHLKIVAGMEGLEEAASYAEVDQVICAISGTLGLRPTLAVINAGKDIGLANKEALVSGGALVMALVKEKGVTLLPIDSEHSAIYQCLNGENPKAVRRIVLTASGGPFREMSLEQLQSVSVDHALRHPTWSMGPKITIDCSTLMNKGLEVIETHWLFGMPYDKIEVVIHPQSIIHSMVEYQDGSILAQMGVPSMIVPIQYAMTFPHRMPGLLEPFDFVKNHTIQFYQPDLNKFACLRLAFEAIKQGGSLPCYMNAANEVLVNRFLRKEISWLEIGIMLEKLMSKHHLFAVRSIEDVLAVDLLARQEAENIPK